MRIPKTAIHCDDFASWDHASDFAGRFAEHNGEHWRIYIRHHVHRGRIGWEVWAD